MLLERLKSSGTKIMMRGPIVRELCVGRNKVRKNKQALVDEFQGVFRPHLFLCAAGLLP